MTIGKAAVAGMLLAGCAPAKLAENGRIAIRLAGHEVAPANELTRAEQFAGRVFASAGIHVVWVRCRTGLPENPCAGSEGPTDFQLQILDRRPNGREEAAGFAVVYPGGGGVGGYAAVSYPQAIAASRQCSQAAYLALGAAMAHEIGHLLLGPKAHAGRGVMSARIGCGELRRAAGGELRFDSEQARRMRAEVARRSE